MNPVRAGLPGGLVVDLVLLGLAGLAARTGARRGAVVPAFELAGLLVALAVGLTVAAPLGAGSSPLVHLGGDVLVVLLAVMIGRRVAGGSGSRSPPGSARQDWAGWTPPAAPCCGPRWCSPAAGCWPTC